MNRDEQFLEYANLDSSLFTLSTLQERKISSNLSGKPTKIWKDILKKFFTNPTATIAFVVIVLVIGFAVFVPIFSKYGAATQIYGIENLWITSLPPSFSPVVEEQFSNSRIGLFYDILKNKDLFPNFNPNDVAINIGAHGLSETQAQLFIDGSEGVIKEIKILPGRNYLVTYNKYDMIRAVLASSVKDGKPDPEFTALASSPISTIFGTDSQGFDLWTRTWAATRDSLVLAITVVVFEAIIGVAIGSYLGFFAGTWIDTILTRFIDIIRNIPITLWFLILISFFSSANFLTLFIALVAVGWTRPVYITRLWIITVKDQEFIKASKSIGAGTNRLIFLHALPLVIGKLLTTFVWRIVNVIFLVSSLSFLGFVPSSDFIDLGKILQNAIGQSKFNIWALVLPTIILLLTSLSAQFIANGLHDALDPKVLKGAK